MNKSSFFPLPRMFSLLFRCGTLIGTGALIQTLWTMCRLQYSESWGLFYAVWLPVLYALFSVSYAMMLWGMNHDLSDQETAQSEHDEYLRFSMYDDYTYLAFLGIFILELSAPHFKPAYYCLFIVYLALVVIKSTILLTYLYRCLCRCSEQSSPTPTFRVPKRMQAIIFFCALLVYVSISAYHFNRTSTTGDEPHYLLITHSLWRDYDTNLYNNYANRDYTSFFWYELQPSWGDTVNETTVYSYRHKGAFPLMLLPGYVSGGRIGATLEMNIIAALILLQVFALSYELFHSITASFLTWLCVAFTIPMIIYMGQIYPDPLAALFAIAGVRCVRTLRFGEAESARQLWKNGLCFGITLLLLVALKARYLPIAGGLILFLLAQIFQGKISFRRKWLIGLATAGCVVIAAIAVMLADNFWLNHMFRDRITDSRFMAWMLEDYNPLFGFFGLLFDQEYGLLIYAPIYMVALVGIGELKRGELQETLPILGVVFLNYLAISFWSLWHAAPTPPARYILPILPLLGVFLAKFFAPPIRVLKATLTGVFAIWSFLAAWVVTFNPKWRYNWADGANNFLEQLSFDVSINLTRLFPSWIRISELTLLLTGIAVLMIAAIIYACRRPVRRDEQSPPRQSLEYVPALVLAICLAGCLAIGFLGKMLPPQVLEAEDLLDMRPQGGERIPQSLDPWDNQEYLRTWKYAGWKLESGDRLQMRPKLAFPAKFRVGELRSIRVYARAERESSDIADAPVILIRVNGEELGKAAVNSTAWKEYAFIFTAQENRPRIEISYERSSPLENAIIVDKVYL